MRELMMLFGVTLAKRYTKSQKRIFYSQIPSLFKDMGHAIEYQTASKFSRLTNILIGDIQKAKVAILCPFDTPSRSLLPFKYYPFNWSENRRQENHELLIRTLIYAIIALFIYLIAHEFASLDTIIKVLSVAAILGLVFFGYKLISGFPNPVNFNKNSASLALLTALAESNKKNSSICYVLLDNNAVSTSGLNLLKEDPRFADKKMIYLDCVAEGDTVACLHGANSAAEAKKLVKVFDELEVIDQSFSEERLKDTYLNLFPQMLHLCIGTIEKKKFLVRNTRSKRDVKVDIPRLETIKGSLTKYLGDK